MDSSNKSGLRTSCDKCGQRQETEYKRTHTRHRTIYHLKDFALVLCITMVMMTSVDASSWIKDLKRDIRDLPDDLDLSWTAPFSESQIDYEDFCERGRFKNKEDVDLSDAVTQLSEDIETLRRYDVIGKYLSETSNIGECPVWVEDGGTHAQTRKTVKRIYKVLGLRDLHKLNRTRLPRKLEPSKLESHLIKKLTLTMLSMYTRLHVTMTTENVLSESSHSNAASHVTEYMRLTSDTVRRTLDLHHISGVSRSAVCDQHKFKPDDQFLRLSRGALETDIISHRDVFCLTYHTLSLSDDLLQAQLKHIKRLQRAIR